MPPSSSIRNLCHAREHGRGFLYATLILLQRSGHKFPAFLRRLGRASLSACSQARNQAAAWLGA